MGNSYISLGGGYTTLTIFQGRGQWMSDLNILVKEYWGAGVGLDVARARKRTSQYYFSLLNRRLWKWLVERI